MAFLHQSLQSPSPLLTLGRWWLQHKALQLLVSFLIFIHIFKVFIFILQLVFIEMLNVLRLLFKLRRCITICCVIVVRGLL